jgi:hypothetical protein
MQLKRQDMAIKDGALTVAREVLAVQQAKREHDEAAQAAVQAAAPLERDGRANRVIEAWKRRRLLDAAD